MEALTTLESLRKARSRFDSAVEVEFKEAKRNRTSPSSAAFADHLRSALSESALVAREIEARLFGAVASLSIRATLIETTAEIIRASLAERIIPDPTDNLILACILGHAAGRPSDAKAFLIENRRCFFDAPDARAALEGAGIKYFGGAAECLEWLDRSPESRMDG